MGPVASNGREAGCIPPVYLPLTRCGPCFTRRLHPLLVHPVLGFLECVYPVAYRRLVPPAPLPSPSPRPIATPRPNGTIVRLSMPVRTDVCDPY